MGVTGAQAASGLLVICVVQGVLSIVLWLGLYRWAPRFAVPAAIALAATLLALTVGSGWLQEANLRPQLEIVSPVFTPFVVVSLALPLLLALPLFMVTMAG